jgi:hypothetical protein
MQRILLIFCLSIAGCGPALPEEYAVSETTTPTSVEASDVGELGTTKHELLSVDCQGSRISEFGFHPYNWWDDAFGGKKYRKRAQDAAIAAWETKAKNTYGLLFRLWNNAANKSGPNCRVESFINSWVCEVGGRPCSCTNPCTIGTYDGTNCYVATPPAGTTPFIWQGGLYHTPAKVPTCPLSGSQYDGSNCYVATPPPGTTPFIWQGGLYYTAAPGGSCPLPGSQYDGSNCYVATPPAGTTPFIWQGGLYYTPLYTPSCPLSGSQYDGSNCYVATPPAGTTPFIWQGGLYYTAICRYP